MAIALDLDLTAEDVSRLISADALAAFFQRMGYSTGKRAAIPAQAVGLDGLSDIRHIELLSEDPDGFLRVLFVQLRSVTAKLRNTLVRTFGQQNQDYLLVLTSDFEALEFVLIEKVRHQRKGPGGDSITKPQAKVFVVPRRWPQNMLRIVRRLTFTARDEAGQPDAILQYAKLVSVFDAAHYGGEYFQNRALFADHYLRTRLPEDPAWRQPANDAFAQVSQLMRQARDRFAGQNEAAIRQQLFEPLFAALSFAPQPGRKPGDVDLQPDYRLPASSGEPRTVALVYAWERWLDGPDAADPDAPNENPGAAVVTLLERGDADWVIVSNGKIWRLYSRQAHSRSTNFYEVDLEDALLASGQTDPNEAFRYWWLFFRESAFAPVDDKKGCWLDRIAAGSRDYAREVEAQLKRRVFYEVVPQLAGGFLEDRRTRLNDKSTPTDAELEHAREATLTLLYRILFLLYAESRDLLPVRESAYYAISIKRLKEEIAEAAGIAESQADEKLTAAYQRNVTGLYDRLGELFLVMDGSDLKRNRAVNVPVYNGGLFRVAPAPGAAPGAKDPHPSPLPQKGEGVDVADAREARIARFLLYHKVPDRFLASALDRLSRVPDPKTFGLAFVDYKSLGVRQLGSIYEGLLEFRLKIADADLPPVSEKGKRRSTRLSASRGVKDRTGVKQGEPYLADDNSERKISGSFFTPDPVVQHNVEHTVGPVLNRKLEALRPAFREAEKTYHQALANARANPKLLAGVIKQRLHATGSPVAWSEDDFRAFAAKRAYEHHKDLVEKLFDLKVLDMAMGSGHFLVETVDFTTDAILHFLNAFPVNPVTAAMARTRISILESLGEQGIETDALLEKQLTDVHLIKRHVLKRCIYGVDLNPLATELAKVSLWLDAFTIGAPLSFLDHHVRTGNSLIGASVTELDRVLHEQLFKIDYEPMRRAIREVLLVARLADATAAEAHQSATKYAAARQWLSGYRIVLDVLVAQHFGVPFAAALLHQGFKLDLSSRESFYASLPARDRKLIDQVEEVAQRRHFFHWDLEFPEAFYEPRPGTKQTVEPMANPGFDALVGNPPYVRQELLKADKNYLKTAFARTFDAANDLYVYFMQKEIELLNRGGLMSMIVANKWLRAGYGRKLRAFLLRYTVPQSIVDFGHSPIFPDADTFPCVPIFARRAVPLPEGEQPDEGEAFAACAFPRDDYRPDMPLGPYILTHRKSVPTRLLRAEGWALEDPQAQHLLEKIRNTGVPLKQFCGSSPLYGVKSGFNDAFYIDAAMRDRLIREDKRSAEIIKPLLRGRDIDRWRPRLTDQYIIFTRRGLEIDRYKAVKKHLQQFRAPLEARAGEQAWYELQASPGDDFSRAMFTRKILYQEIQFHSWFSLETEGACVNNKVFLLPTDDLALLGVLSSPLMWWFLTRTLPHMKDEALCPAGFVMEDIRVTVGTDPQADAMRSAVELLVGGADELHQWQQEIRAEACKAVGAEEPDGRIVGWLVLPAEVFASRLAKLAGQNQMPGHLLAKVAALQQRGRSRQVELLSRQLELEKRLAVLVEDAYGLTPEERALLRATRPVRDPLDVLEAKIAGKAIPTVTEEDGD